MTFDAKVFSFQKQLSTGQLGEELLLKHYHMPVILSDDRKYDLRCVHTGHKIELKTDTYDALHTPFFFFERWSDVQKEKPGGPWRAKQDRIPIFVYLFLKNNRYFVFKDVAKMLKKIERLVDKGTIKPVLIANRGWITSGFKVDRELVKAFWTEYEFNPATEQRAKLTSYGISQEVLHD